MPTKNDALKDRLSRYREITIPCDRPKVRTYHLNTNLVRMGRRQPIPSAGSGVGYTVVQERTRITQLIRIAARDAEADFKAVPITDPTQVSSVVEKFRDKYGTNDVKKYYSKFDVAVLAQPR